MINSFAGNLMEINQKLSAIIPVSVMATIPNGKEYTVETF